MTAEIEEDDHGLCWAAGIGTGLVLLVVYFMPKRLNRLEVCATWVVIASLTLAADWAGVVTFKLDDMVNPQMNWQGFTFEILFPPACGVITANFMPTSRILLITYAIVAAIISDWFLWLNVQVGFVTYHHWNLVWSGVVYFLGTIYLRWHVHFIRSQTARKWD